MGIFGNFWGFFEFFSDFFGIFLGLDEDFFWVNNPSVHCNKSPLDGHLFPFKFKSPSSCSTWFGSSCATRCNWLIIHDYKLRQLPDNFQLKWPSVDFNVTRRSTLLTLASRTKVIQRHFCVKCHVTASSQWMLLGSRDYSVDIHGTNCAGSLVVC